MLLDFVRYRRWWYTISLLLLVPGIISLSLWGLKLGIDFTGGSLMEIQTKDGVTVEQVRQSLGDQYGSPIVQSTGDHAFQLKLKTLDPDQRNQVLSGLNQSLGGEVVEERFETVGPTIGADLTRKAIMSVLIGSLLIVAYIAYAFRNVPKPASGWRFGVTTIFALLHDILFTLGVFSLLGHFAGVEVDANFVAAVLTVIGFSVHDTIVVFDRIRENLIKGQGATLEDTVNLSISQTLVRSINTSVTVLLVLGAMLLYGGSSIHYFVLALFVGIAIGTYSSIFNAAPVLVSWQRWSNKRAAKAKN
jgi:preprotein translocase subunit SecF